MQIYPYFLGKSSLQYVLNKLRERHDAYLVGGCVRDAVLGMPVSDIDIATDATPEEVAAIFADSRCALHATGVAHGTWTVVDRGNSYEITTFRRDVATDGRRATVAFSEDIHDDSQRRDFTMNALYMDYAGSVVDPTGEGLRDLMARKVRFVGNAADRCKEDYLRILRLFRFHAKYGKGPMDSDAFWAAEGGVLGLEQVSGERIWAEMKKLLSTHDPVESLVEMERSGVLEQVLPGHGNVGNVSDVCYVERMGSLAPRWVRRYAALMGFNPHTIPLPHSKKEEAHLAQALWGSAVGAASAAFVIKDRPRAFDSQVLRMARSREGYTDPWEEIERGMGADLPVSAQDYMDRGIEPGPRLGAKLRWAKKFFLASDLSASRDTLLMKTNMENGLFR